MPLTAADISHITETGEQLGAPAPTGADRVPPPLVIGSPAARMIYRTFAGYRQSEILLADHDERVAVAAAIAAHLHARSPWDVMVVAERTSVSQEMYRALLPMIPPGVFEEPPFPTKKMLPGERLWLGSPGTDRADCVNVVIHDYESPSVARAAYDRLRAVFVLPCSVAYTSAPEPEFAVADIPLDIVLAGAPGLP